MYESDGIGVVAYCDQFLKFGTIVRIRCRTTRELIHQLGEVNKDLPFGAFYISGLADSWTLLYGICLLAHWLDPNSAASIQMLLDLIKNVPALARDRGRLLPAAGEAFPLSPGWEVFTLDHMLQVGWQARRVAAPGSPQRVVRPPLPELVISGEEQFTLAYETASTPVEVMTRFRAEGGPRMHPNGQWWEFPLPDGCAFALYILATDKESFLTILTAHLPRVGVSIPVIEQKHALEMPLRNAMSPLGGRFTTVLEVERMFPRLRGLTPQEIRSTSDAALA